MIFETPTILLFRYLNIIPKSAKFQIFWVPMLDILELRWGKGSFDLDLTLLCRGFIELNCADCGHDNMINFVSYYCNDARRFFVVRLDQKRNGGH